jgi:predicted DNA-binding transcriptional regulator YafY
VQEVVLSISPDGAEDALGWRFHPTQQVTKEADGSVTVRFRASGMLELSWHLFTWGDKVTVIEPPLLRERLVAELETALNHHRAAP